MCAATSLVDVDVMRLLDALVGAGVVAGSAVAALVYWDCARRRIRFRVRVVHAFACGAGTAGCFLLPYVFSQELQYAYFRVLRPRPLAATPGEWLSVALGTGLLLGTGFVGLYLAGTRLHAR